MCYFAVPAQFENLICNRCPVLPLNKKRQRIINFMCASRHLPTQLHHYCLLCSHWLYLNQVVSCINIDQGMNIWERRPNFEGESEWRKNKEKWAKDRKFPRSYWDERMKAVKLISLCTLHDWAQLWRWQRWFHIQDFFFYKRFPFRLWIEWDFSHSFKDVLLQNWYSWDTRRGYKTASSGSFWDRFERIELLIIIVASPKSKLILYCLF